MRCSRLTRSLQTHKKDYGCCVLSLEIQRRYLITSQELHHLVVNNLGELLTGIDGLEDLLAKRLIER